MTTSGNYTLALTRNEIAGEVYELLQVAADGETLSGDLISRFERSANLLLKAWQANGFATWLETEGSLFLEVGTSKYDLSTSKVTNEWYKTTTTAATTAGAYVLPVTSVANIQVGDTIGVIQDNNDLFWSTVKFINTLNITLVDPITRATVSGAKVRNYRDTFIPVSRVTDIRRLQDTNETRMVELGREEYFQLPDKESTGTPVQAYYERSDVAGDKYGVMRLWNSPDSSDPVINFTYERKAQIFTGTDETVDLPDYAQQAFIYNVAKSMILKVGCSPERAGMIMAEADRLLGDMLSYNSESHPIKVRIGRG